MGTNQLSCVERGDGCEYNSGKQHARVGSLPSFDQQQTTALKGSTESIKDDRIHSTSATRSERNIPHNKEKKKTHEPVGHEPGGLELPHVGVDKRVSGLSRLPLLQEAGVRPPRLSSGVASRAPQVEDGVAVLDGAVAEEVSHQELEGEPVG